ncbi:3-phosphoserine/phosphohydroxythreonine transaminase [Leptospira sp. 96542]|nr:3-phosphoserine/phosphohydroxythreonine transaminase [Leptospira sp. 96542]
MANFTHRVYNFNAGPAMLPTEVMEIAQNEFLNYRGSGMSVMEMSHRETHFQSILDEATDNLRQLLELPKNYEVVFFPGGATLQFSAIPFNYLKQGESADFSLTGVWSNKAFEEAKKFYPRVREVFNGKESNFMEIPEITDQMISDDAKYLYITSNNTIYGTRYQSFPKIKKAPLIADMTSELLSRKLAVEDFSVIFAGAQKNIGPSGLTIVIFNKEKLPEVNHPIPNLMNYTLMAKNKSLYNTPPTYSIYIAGLVFQYLKKLGGISKMEEINERKAKKLYDTIDSSSFFYAPVPKNNRSTMNVVFRSKDANLDTKFLKLAGEQGFAGLKGYRDMGGFRASIYNAMPEEGVDALISFIKEFEKSHV